MVSQDYNEIAPSPAIYEPPPAPRRRSLAASDPLAVDFGTDGLREEIERALIERVRSVVTGCKERDDDLYLLRQQNEGVSQPGVQGPWPNSCILEHPISREMHTTAHSNVMAALRQKPWVTMEALDPADDDRVQRTETVANTEADLFGFDKSISDMVYTALESRFAPTMVRYEQSVTKTKTVERFPIETSVDAGIFEQAYTAPIDMQWEEQLRQNIDVTEQIVLDHIDPWDFYTDPIGASGPEIEQGCIRCVHRVWLNEEMLLAGVVTEQYDEERVAELLAQGPTAVLDDNTPRRDMEAMEGLNAAKSEFYECYRIVGRLPYLDDGTGRARLPERFMHEDFHILCCPSHDIVFKLTFSPFPVRPYDVANAIRVPGRMCGHGVVSMLSAIQDEMTAIVRALIDSVNLTMNPMLKVPEQWMGFYSKWTSMPGRHLPYKGNQPGSVVPLEWDRGGMSIAFEMLGWLDALGSRVVAAQGVNSSLGGKVRKAAEVQFADQVIQNKFALMLANLQMSVQNIFRIYLATRLYYLQDKISVREGDSQVEVTADDLRARCKIIPHANADNASAVQRIQTDAAVRQILGTSPTYQSRIAMGDYTGSYKLDEMTLSHLGVQNPQALLGREPVEGSPEALLIQTVAMLQQAAQADPVAAQILMRLRTMAMQGGGLQQPGEQSAAVPASGLNPPDMSGQAETHSDQALAHAEPGLNGMGAMNGVGGQYAAA